MQITSQKQITIFCLNKRELETKHFLQLQQLVSMYYKEPVLNAETNKRL